MVQYPKGETEVLSLFSYINSQYMIKSLLFRKQPKVEIVDNSAMITWGPSLIIGGLFSNKLLRSIKETVQHSKFPSYIYLPDGEWESAIKNEFTDNLTEKQINLYQNQDFGATDFRTELQGIVPITDSWFNRALQNSQLVKDELYS